MTSIVTIIVRPWRPEDRSQANIIATGINRTNVAVTVRFCNATDVMMCYGFNEGKQCDPIRSNGCHVFTYGVVFLPAAGASTKVKI